MTSAALPAAEIGNDWKNVPKHLRLVHPRDDKPVFPRHPVERDTSSDAEDPDDMWDNMPV